MSWFYKLARYKMVLTMVAAVVMGLVFAPSWSLAASSTDTFGIGPLNTELSGTLGNSDLRTTIASLINVALSLLGVIAVVIILAGGFKWMTAGGNDDKVQEARKMIFSGVIGLAIIMSSWAIALFVLNRLRDATNSGAIPTGLDTNG